MTFENTYTTTDKTIYKITVKTINNKQCYFGNFKIIKQTESVQNEYKSEMFINNNLWNLMKIILLNADYHLINTENFNPENLLHKIWVDFFDYQQPKLITG